MYETFWGLSTQLGNLFVAVGNSELSNKMAPYRTNQKVSVIKTCYSSGGSYVAVETIHV
jgi:hypothetical protein